MEFGFKRHEQQRQIKPKGEGCKMKIKRDSNGRIIGYQDNGQCSPQQIKAFNEKINISENSEDE